MNHETVFTLEATPIKFGPGSSADAGWELKRLGASRVMVVSDPGVIRAGITERVVALNGQAVVQPTMVLTLSCDHRALDGAGGARFLGALADLVEEPLALLQ